MGARLFLKLLYTYVFAILIVHILPDSTLKNASYQILVEMPSSWLAGLSLLKIIAVFLALLIVSGMSVTGAFALDAVFAFAFDFITYSEIILLVLISGIVERFFPFLNRKK